MPNTPAKNLSTTVIHGDHAHNPTRGMSPPIFQTSTFRWENPEDGMRLAHEYAPADFYTRLGNPNVHQLQALLAALEGSEDALATASGMAAATLSVLPFVAAGDHIIGGRTLYGYTRTLLSEVLPRFGVQSTLIGSCRPEDYAAAIRPNTRLIMVETPANPTLECIDLAAVAALSHAAGVRLVVDNTFATPVNTQPLSLGADIVFHSATKYLSGHSDVVAGVLCSDRGTIERAWQHLRVVGSVLGPFEAWLVTRGLRTLPLRMQRHNENGLRVAKFLAAHPRVAGVNYPGLKDHPGHQVAARQMRGFGGMLSVDLHGGHAAARRFFAALKLFARATSLGGLESLAQYPSCLSNLSDEEQRASGISPTLVRLSVGCEDIDDILADLGQALEAASH